MKILQIFKDYYPPVNGGIERHVNLLSNGLRLRGIDSEVLVSNTCLRSLKEIINGIPVTKVFQIGRFASAPINPTFLLWLRRLGKDVDIMHFHMPNPTADLSYLLSGLNGHVVVTYHSDIIRQEKMLKLYYPFLLKFLSKAKIIIATSNKYLNSSHVLRNFRSKCAIIPLGIDLSMFPSSQSDEHVASLLKRHGSPLIIFIGQFRYYKGLHILIDAMKKIPAKLILVGSGPLERRLRRQVTQSKLTDKVLFLGELPDSLMIQYLRASDMLILPSHLRSEAFGVVQLEAMACQKPVISTELGTGTSAVNLHRVTGLVIPPNNVGALIGAVNHLIENPKLREQYGKTGRRLVEQYYNANDMVDKTIEVYERILTKTIRLSNSESY